MKKRAAPADPSSSVVVEKDDEEEESEKMKTAGVGVKQLRVGCLIVLWMFISISLIMYNKWLLSYKGYRYPLAMTMTHQACTATLAHVAARLGYVTPPVLTWDQLKNRIMPIATLFAASISLSNLAVSYLTVPFMQMLKASIPTFSLVLGFATGTETFNVQLLGCVVGIGLGVMIASLGEIEFVPVGFGIAIVGLLTEAARLVLTQRLLQGQDIKFNAISGNYYTAPIAFMVLAVPFCIFEFTHYSATVDLADMFPHIIVNGALAAALNVSVFVVLKETSAVTYGIAGQVKDWMNILIAIPVFHNTVSLLQFFGYSIAVSGVFYYKRLRTKLAEESKIAKELELQNAARASNAEDGSAEETKAPLLSAETTK